MLGQIDRSTFYPIEIIDGGEVHDILRGKINQFRPTRPVTHYAIPAGKAARPDLISIDMYGSADYWWILMEYNAIDDIWYDLTVGTVLQVPNREDVAHFYLSHIPESVR